MFKVKRKKMAKDGVELKCEGRKFRTNHRKKDLYDNRRQIDVG